MSAIKAGDLVMVVRPAKCGCWPGEHSVFVVRDIYHQASVRCASCWADLGSYSLAATSDGYQYGLHRLKRIPPLEELDKETRKEEITA